MKKEKKNKNTFQSFRDLRGILKHSSLKENFEKIKVEMLAKKYL